MPMSQPKNLEQIHQNQLICGMYGLAAKLSISSLTTSKNIDEIRKSYCYIAGLDDEQDHHRHLLGEDY